MGLDMYVYLVKSEYKSKFYGGGCTYPNEFEKFEVDIEKHNFKSMSVKTKCQVGYWRKANAIHNWIVENCASGVDECQEINMSEAKLKELLNVCEKVKKNPDKASELLPTTKGFFFGSQEYDKWYFQDLKYTISLIKKILDFLKNNEANADADYYVVYEASW